MSLAGGALAACLALGASSPARGTQNPPPGNAPLGNPPLGSQPPAAPPRLEPLAIDLSADTSRRVLVDRVPGEYLGPPSTVLLEDGRTLFVVYPKGPGAGPLVLRKSADGGLTWSGKLPTPMSWRTCRDTPTLHRLIDAQGKSRLFVFTGQYPLRMSCSEDDGQTWTELAPIGDFGGLTAMSSIERRKDGTYLGFFHDDGRFIAGKGVTLDAPRFIIFKCLSSDGGLTWSKPARVAQHAEADLAEPCAVRSPDGNEIALILRENRRQRGSASCSTRDEGVTWTEAHEIRLALTGDRHVARYAPDGRLVVSFRDMVKQSPSFGDWVVWVGTYQDLSNNYPGQYRVRLLDEPNGGADCAYSDVEVLPDGTFVLTGHGRWNEGEEPYVMSVRLRLAELDELARRR